MKHIFYVVYATLVKLNFKTFLPSTSQAMELKDKIHCQKITTVLAGNGWLLVLAAKHHTSQDKKSFITHAGFVFA